MLYELRPNLVTNLDGQWESYRVFTAPVNWLFESGDRFEFNIMPEGDRPLILQKAGGLQSTFSYIAFAPTRGVAVFVAINKFDFGAAMGMAEVANDLIAVLAPR